MKAGAATVAGLAIAPDKLYGAVVENVEHSGMDKVLLEFNSVGGENILTQAMINHENTIYIIKYDYVLNGKIIIPNNCILLFDGGSLCNGTITGHPLIIAPNVCIFDNISIELCNDFIYANWWRFGNNKNKNNINLQQVFDAAYSARGCVVKFTRPINFSQTINIWTLSSNSYTGYTLIIEGQQTEKPLLIFDNSKKESKAFVITSKSDVNSKKGHCVIFRNISIKSDNASYLIYTDNASKIEINNCGLKCPNGVCLYSKKIWVWRIEESFIEGKVGVRAISGTSAYISNLFVKCSEYGIDIGNSYVHISNVFGDYATGTLGRFNYCRGDISSIAAESPKLSSFIEAVQSLLEIQSVFLFNLESLNASIFTGRVSSIHVGSMFVNGKGETGYLENGSWNLRIEIEKLVTELLFKRAIHDQYDTGSGVNVIKWSHDSNPGSVQSSASERSWYRPVDDVTLQTDTYDGYYKNPKYPKKARLILGSVAPSLFIENSYDNHGKLINSVSQKNNNNVNLGDVFINSDVNYSSSDGVFFGWVCSGHASKSDKTFGNAKWKKVQFVLSGKSRPTGLNKNHVGLQFFDETLSPKRPIWWNGSVWVDANGKEV